MGARPCRVDSLSGELWKVRVMDAHVILFIIFIKFLGRWGTILSQGQSSM